MRHSILLKILLVLSVFCDYATAAAADDAGARLMHTVAATPSTLFEFERAIGSKYHAPATAHRFDDAIARADLKTDNSLLFQIGNLCIMGTIHSLPITIFPPSVRNFLDTMKTRTHLHEHECIPYDEKYLNNIGGEALTVEESVFPHLEKFRRELPEFMKAAFEEVIKMYDPKTIKPWAALTISLFGSQTISDIYIAGMDDAIEEMTERRLPLETTKEMFEAMGLPALTAEEIFDAGEEEEESPKEQNKENALDSYRIYLSGDLGALEKEMNVSDDDPKCIFFKSRKPRNTNFAKNTLRYLAEGAKDEVFFVSMGINHLLGEYGYLNLMSALLGKPLLRFDAATGAFVPSETYLDAFAPKHPELLGALRAQGIEPLV